MLRIISFIVAVAAMLAIPFSQADARSGRSGGGSMRMSSGHIGGGPRVSSFKPAYSINKVHVGSRPIIVGKPGHIIVGKHRHHRRYPFFVGVGAYGLYDTCWRWVPGVYGYRRVWVCDYPYPYY
jgi:hypothetical protein